MTTDTDALLRGAREGSRRDLARLLSLVESGPEAAVRAIVRGAHDSAGSAHTIGITGSPGVGKSTLTGALVEAVRADGRTVAVLAVDPSSPFTGGALLGDRVRLADLVLDDGVFIRSMATRGHLGGLSWATPAALMVLAAVGFDVVIVETVGVGQAEVEVATLADSTVVVLAPGMGDAVQAAKAGILEVADLFVVNKADHDGADRTVRELTGALSLATDTSTWRPPILTTVAHRGEGAGHGGGGAVGSSGLVGCRGPGRVGPAACAAGPDPRDRPRHSPSTAVSGTAGRSDAGPT